MNDELVKELEILRKGREQLLCPYLDRNSKLYRCLYKYYKSTTKQSLFQSLQYLKYLEEQFHLIDDPGLSDVSKRKLTRYVSKLIDGKIDDTSITPSSDFFNGLLKEKQKVLGSIIDVSNEQDKKISQIEFDYDRDKFLFEKEFAEELCKMDDNEIENCSNNKN